MDLVARDRVWVTDSLGMKIAQGTVINVNDLREPSTKYATDVDDYNEDLLFFGEGRLIKQEVIINE